MANGAGAVAASREMNRRSLHYRNHTPWTKNLVHRIAADSAAIGKVVWARNTDEPIDLVSMAILLGAFLIHGLVPGPDMLTKNLSITYAMVWSIALANILGAGLCYLFSGHFARIATLRYTLILPCVLGIIYIGAFEGSRSWGDLFSLLFFGVLGWTMKQMKWPRPPLVLGFVLGDIIERYMFISVERYGLEWMARPVVMVLFALAIVGLMRPFLQDIARHGGIRGMLSGFSAPRFEPSAFFAVFMIVLLGAMVIEASDWNFGAKIVPLTVGGLALAFVTISLLNQVFRRPAPAVVEGSGEGRAAGAQERIHMDIDSGTQHLPTRVVAQRGLVFFGWLLAFMGSMAIIGLIPTVPLFVIAYMRSEAREPWKLVLPQAIGLTLFIYIVFDRLLTIPWPQTLLGTFFPILKAIPSL